MFVMRTDLSVVIRLLVLVREDLLQPGLSVLALVESEEGALGQDHVGPSDFGRMDRAIVCPGGIQQLQLIALRFDLHQHLSGGAKTRTKLSHPVLVEAFVLTSPL